MNLNDYLRNHSNIFQMEGHSNQVPEQENILKQIVNNPNINHIMEIGFNAGHSADTFLSNNSKATLTSFDLGVHSYVPWGKSYIDKNYPFRHRLILGNSLETVSEFADKNPYTKFDLIFIDGGHDYVIAKGDMQNCKRLAHENTIVILDDTYFLQGEYSYNRGPNRVWNEFINNNEIEPITSYHFSPGRGMSICRYRF